MNDLFYSGDSKNELCGFDFRQNKNIFQIKNESMINSIHVHKSSKFILIGDHDGRIKTFDLRNLQCIDDYLISNTPISSISVSKNLEEGRYLSVSSYDNVIRM
jgi:WD40 repeat protein